MASIGLIIPQRGALFGVGELPDLLRLAPAAEQSGFFDAVWVGDSLTSKSRAESIACLSAIAGMTSTVRLGVGCMATFSVRDPALFAYQWATLDALSGGRTLLAVCNGLQKRDEASEREGAHFGGVPDKERVLRLEEYVGLVRQLWTGEPITFHGRFAHYDDIMILPRPVQQPCPIWISANPPSGPAAVRVVKRVAAISDGLLTIRTRPGYISDIRRMLDAQLLESGRDPSTFPLGAYHNVNIGADAEKCLDEAMNFYDAYYGAGTFDRTGAASMSAVGPADQCAEQLRAVVAEGVTHLSLRIASWSQREQLDTLVEKVLPALTA
jgi:alkanesulfonate monooxygenase SsuD/methylene tetrahydromethanopterin reductase-like flavin-dependent oxidoreductase (luciferase family)